MLNGKNAIAGAINILSNKPTDEFEAGLSGSYEFENEGYLASAYASGPLADNLAGRLFVQQQETGGYLDFPRTGRSDQNESEFLSFKGALQYYPNDKASLLLRYDRQEAEQRGTEFGVFRFQDGVREAYEAEYRSNDPDFDYVTEDTISNGKLLDIDGEGNVLVTDERQKAGTDIDVFSANFGWEFDDSGQFTSITSFITYDSYGLQTQSFRPVDLLTVGDRNEDESYDQITQELRYVSPVGERLEYMAGLYYFSADLDIGKNDSVVNSTALGFIPEWNFLPIDDFSQDTESISVFGQATWNINSDLRAALGLRYTWEEKEADASLVFLSTDRSMVVGGSAPGEPGFNPVADLFGSNWSDRASRSEETLDPSLVLQWDVIDSGMVYMSWTRATKAGGFNAGDLDGASFEYDEEEATSVEIGSKLSLLDDRLRWNVAVFSTEFHDLQVSAWDATQNTFVTDNAAEATVEGFESDVVYAIHSGWTIGGAVGYLDAGYDDYPGASCSAGESREADCGADGVRNAAGDDLRQAPEWTANAYIEYSGSLTDEMNYGFRLTANYSDSYFMSATNDPYLRVDSYTKTDALVWLGAEDGTWRVSLLGRNLSDERVVFFGNSTPLVDDAYFSSIQPGREVFLEFAYRM